MKRGDDSIIAVATTVITSWMLLQAQTVVASFVPVQLQQERHKAEPKCAFLSAANAVASSTTMNIPEWTPRSRYWKDNDIMDMSRNDLAELMGLDIQLIVDDPTSSQHKATETLEQQQQPTVKKLHRNKLHKVIAVEVSSALSEMQALRIQTMAASIRTRSSSNHNNNNETLLLNHHHHHHHHVLFEHRSFGPDKGGNDCTYLAPLLQLLMPEIAQTVVSIAQLAWVEADWQNEEEEQELLRSSTVTNDPQQVILLSKKYPNPMNLGIRTSEHLSYDGWRSLEPHKDVGSIYTCNIALKDPNDFQGGEFFLQTSFLEQIEVKPERLSAIVFLSDTTHGVRPITSGSRVSFVTEFWNHDDAPLGMNRPTPNEWEEFLQKQR